MEVPLFPLIQDINMEVPLHSWIQDSFTVDCRHRNRACESASAAGVRAWTNHDRAGSGVYGERSVDTVQLCSDFNRTFSFNVVLGAQQARSTGLPLSASVCVCVWRSRRSVK